MMMYKAKKANKFLWGSELVQLNSVNFHMEIQAGKQNKTKRNWAVSLETNLIGLVSLFQSILFNFMGDIVFVVFVGELRVCLKESGP